MIATERWTRRGPSSSRAWDSRRARERARRRLHGHAFCGARNTAQVHTEGMAHLLPSPAEVVLPIAIARPHQVAEYRTAVLGSISRWLDERWRFVAPRFVPATLALVGMMLVLAAMDLMASRCRLEPRGDSAIYLVGDPPP